MPSLLSLAQRRTKGRRKDRRRNSSPAKRTAVIPAVPRSTAPPPRVRRGESEPSVRIVRSLRGRELRLRRRIVDANENAAHTLPVSGEVLAVEVEDVIPFPPSREAERDRVVGPGPLVHAGGRVANACPGGIGHVEAD